ncbi:protein suppressor of forked isoform X3 [Condylostylus longicornis]|uniref:protein suppressor of forked isoform X3 n=1 Tax=Condylostylus longicornis TaxID=2530218 RepID=UPI00244D9B72|nr:protein suppressor of forked isoform X3 [Condylostylus longicornis]
MSVKEQIKIDIEWGHERLVRAQQTVELRPYDIESWSVLLREAQNRHVNEVRSLYESLVSVFPTTAKYWKMYIEQEIKARNFERVEKLFQRCLVKILNIELWKLYLTYVKETKAGLATHKEKLAQAYDFALEKIGMDLHSFSIWQDYIHFLKSVEAVGSYAENQKITAVRKVYQKAVVTPAIGIEALWKEYINFEQNINPIISEKMSLERSKDYMNARRVAKELEIITKGLNRNLPAIPPTLTREERIQIELWRKYISFEKSNPLRSEDTALVTRRVMFATEQCLLVLTHHPAVWHQAAQFLDQSAKLLTEKGEYYCSKDKDIAFRIFELGLKRFGGSPEYVMCYIDYLSHLNEDNNTRVLFERVLSSGGLTPQLSVDVWNRFLEFESNIGDLSSIVKVERRRCAVLENLKEYEGKETAQLVDRYKFLDLYPCTTMELKSIGYSDNIVFTTANKNNVTFEAINENVVCLVRPDFSQMIPFKPKSNAYPNEHPLEGGTFPQPPALAALCARLPPPVCFRGPFVAVDMLTDIFTRIQLPDAPVPIGDHGFDTKLFDLSKSVHWIIDESQYSGDCNSIKRRRMLPGGDDSDEENQISAPPINDIYRLRQQKRFIK